MRQSNLTYILFHFELACDCHWSIDGPKLLVQMPGRLLQKPRRFICNLHSAGQNMDRLVLPPSSHKPWQSCFLILLLRSIELVGSCRSFFERVGDFLTDSCLTCLLLLSTTCLHQGSQRRIYFLSSILSCKNIGAIHKRAAQISTIGVPIPSS